MLLEKDAFGAKQKVEHLVDQREMLLQSALFFVTGGSEATCTKPCKY